MEIESKAVRLLPDGKKLIDVTLRRAVASPPTEPQFVVPNFDDDDSSSSSSDDDDRGARAPSMPVEHSPLRRDGPEDNEQDDDSSVDNNNRTSAAQFTWDSVSDIQQLTNVNGQLTSQVHELKRELQRMEVQLEALAPVPGLDAKAVSDLLLDKDSAEHDLRDKKIVHQAKSIRHLKRTIQRDKHVAVEATKRCKQLETDNTALAKEVEHWKLKCSRIQARQTAAAAETGMLGDDNNAQSVAPEKDRDASTWKKKVDEWKAKHDKLVLDLKKMQRALVREVGDDVPIDELLEATDSTAKRGRAQQIVMLKAKVKKLEAQLAQGNSASTGNGGAPPTDVDARAQMELMQQQGNRQRQLDKLTQEKEELQEKAHALTKKLDALKSRAQVLEKEKNEAKDKFQVFVDKSKTDDALIDALQKQLEAWKARAQESKRARTAESPNVSTISSSNMSKDERQELDKLRVMVLDYKRQLEDKKTSISGAMSAMPPQKELAQYRTAMAEKERLVEAVKSLQQQLEEKEKQLRARAVPTGLPPPVRPDEHTNSTRIPRMHAVLASSKQVSHDEIETLRRSFRETVKAKDDEISQLQQQLAAAQQPSGHPPQSSPQDNAAVDATQELVAELQEENTFLRQEFSKLKARYEKLLHKAK